MPASPRRDKESAKDYHELIHENVELGERCERWKERAEMLQQERWGFVAKWREGKMAGLSLAQGRKVDLDHHPADAGEEEAVEEPPSDSSSDDEPADDSDSDL